MKKINVYKPTNDDWYPAYQVEGWDNLQLVCVTFTQTGPDPARGMANGVFVFGVQMMLVWKETTTISVKL